MNNKKLVILGAGIGGLNVVKESTESGVPLDDLDITVVDEDFSHFLGFTLPGVKRGWREVDSVPNRPSALFASTLRDGGTVLLRRVEPADIDAVIALHAALTDRERYSRFFTMHPACLKTVADKLTDDSGKDYALGAFDSGTLIGVANYVVCDRPETADVAVVVAHNDRLRGVGTTLLRRLAQVARANGIQHFVADVLTTNHLMFKVLHNAGLQPRHMGTGNGVVHLDINLAEIASESI